MGLVQQAPGVVVESPLEQRHPDIGVGDVRSANHESAARDDQPGDPVQHGLWIEQVLEHVAREHDVEFGSESASVAGSFRSPTMTSSATL